jgi:hypothetical protein
VDKGWAPEEAATLPAGIELLHAKAADEAAAEGSVDSGAAKLEGLEIDGAGENAVLSSSAELSNSGSLRPREPAAASKQTMTGCSIFTAAAGWRRVHISGAKC